MKSEVALPARAVEEGTINRMAAAVAATTQRGAAIPFVSHLLMAILPVPTIDEADLRALGSHPHSRERHTKRESAVWASHGVVAAPAHHQRTARAGRR